MKQKSKLIIAATVLSCALGITSAQADSHNNLIDLIKQAFTTVANAIIGLDQRVTALENANPNFGGYGLPFSADGAPKNVIVSSQVLPGGEVSYSVRSRYATSTEQISIDGVPTQRPFIANYASVLTDSLGNFISAGNYIEAPDTEDYINFNVEESTYDSAANKTVVADTVRELWPCSAAGGVLTCLVAVTENSTGNITDHYTWSYARTLLDSVTVNGMTFNDVRVEQMLSSNFSRVRAKGIGEVLRMTNNGDRGVIYYRVNGATGGSLAGTPFDAGQPFDGVFF